MTAANVHPPEPDSGWERAAASLHRSPFKVGDRVIRKYDGKVGEVAGIDVKGRLTVYFKDGTRSILPAQPHTYQRSTR